MFQIALFEPEIPPNTGNIIRLCANTGSVLHLIEPLGFSLDARELKRAGLDYHQYASINTYTNYTHFSEATAKKRVFALSTHATYDFYEARFQPGDVFLFGPETRGLPTEIRDSYLPGRLLRVPMTLTSRSLNLSNVVAIVIYEAWRQCRFNSLGKLRPQEKFDEGSITDNLGTQN